MIAFSLGGSQPVDRQARDDRDEPGLGGLEHGAIRLMPAQPGVLKYVVRVGTCTQHAVGNAEKTRTQRVERIGG